MASRRVVLSVVLLATAWGAGGVQAQSTLPAVRSDTSAVVARPVPAGIEAFRADPAFAYDREQPPSPSLWSRFWRWVGDHIIGPFFDATTETTREVLFYGLLAAAFVVALYRLFGADRQGMFRRRDRAASLEATLAEDGIAAVDLAALADEAVRAGRYREAVRYRYLHLLQLLSAHERIRWAADKPNRAYLAELRGSDLEVPFADATRLFDRAWYGHLPVGVDEAEAASGLLHRLQSALEGRR